MITHQTKYAQDEEKNPFIYNGISVYDRNL